MPEDEKTHFTDKELDTYPAIYEQDVDLVIVIALRASKSVRSLFCNAARIDDRRFVAAHQSVSTLGGREADIEVHLGDPDRPNVLQIEDKIGARFTSGQPEAYGERVERIAASNEFSDVRSLLCAPSGYLANAVSECDHFDGTVSHEDLRDALIDEGCWGRELALIVQHAIQQHRRSGSAAPTDTHLTAQLRAFAAHAADVGIPVPKIGNRAGDTQIWVEKGVLRTPENIDVFIRLVPDAGVVDLELYGFRPRFDEDAFRAEHPEVKIRLSARNIYLWNDEGGSQVDLKQSIDKQQTTVTEQ